MLQNLSSISIWYPFRHFLSIVLVPTSLEFYFSVAGKILPEIAAYWWECTAWFPLWFLVRAELCWNEFLLQEKAREYSCLLFTLSIDLKKEYESVPRAALWQVLQKYWVPLLSCLLFVLFINVWELLFKKWKIVFLKILRSEMVCNRGALSLLYFLFCTAVLSFIADWWQQCSLAGVYSHEHRLVGDLTAQSWLLLWSPSSYHVMV